MQYVIQIVNNGTPVVGTDTYTSLQLKNAAFVQFFGKTTLIPLNAGDQISVKLTNKSFGGTLDLIIPPPSPGSSLNPADAYYTPYTTASLSIALVDENQSPMLPLPKQETSLPKIRRNCPCQSERL